MFGLTRSSNQNITALHTHKNCLGTDSVWSHAQLHSRAAPHTHMDCLGMDSVWSHTQLHSKPNGPSHSHGLPWHGQLLISRAAPVKILRSLTLAWIALVRTIIDLTRSLTQNLAAPHTRINCLGIDNFWSHTQIHSKPYGPSHSHGLPWHGQCLVSRTAPLKIIRPLTLAWISLAWTVFGLTRSSTQDLTAPHTHMDCLGMDSVWSHAQLQATFYGPSHSHKLPW